VLGEQEEKALLAKALGGVDTQRHRVWRSRPVEPLVSHADEALTWTKHEGAARHLLTVVGGNAGVVVRAAGQRQRCGARTRGVPRCAPYVHVLPRSRRQTLAPASVRSASPQPCRAAARRGDTEGEGLSIARSRRSSHLSPPRPAEWAEATTPSSGGGWAPPSRKDAERRSSGLDASASSASESTGSFSEEVRDWGRVTHAARQGKKQPGKDSNRAGGGQWSSSSKLERIRQRRAERLGEEATVEAMMEEEALLSSWGSFDELEGWQASRELKAAVQGARGRGPGFLREAVQQVAASTPLEPASVAKVMMQTCPAPQFSHTFGGYKNSPGNLNMSASRPKISVHLSNCGGESVARGCDIGDDGAGQGALVRGRGRGVRGRAGGWRGAHALHVRQWCPLIPRHTLPSVGTLWSFWEYYRKECVLARVSVPTFTKPLRFTANRLRLALPKPPVFAFCSLPTGREMPIGCHSDTTRVASRL